MEGLAEASASFGDLHDAIQVACGWTDSHLFRFSGAEGRAIGGSAFDDGWGDADPDARAVPLAAWFGDRDRCIYEYDFGDSWHHDVVLRQRLDDRDGQRTLVDGARAFPPEDCGGMYGYEQCVAQATGEIEDDDFADWLGDWEPERFEVDRVRRHFDR